MSMFRPRKIPLTARKSTGAEPECDVKDNGEMYSATENKNADGSSSTGGNVFGSLLGDNQPS